MPRLSPLLLLLAAPAALAQPVPPPRPVADTSAFPAAVAAALAPHFEFLGGEPVRTTSHTGTWHAERFWYAKVRAKTPGRFAFAYSVGFEFGEKAKGSWLWPAAATYSYRIGVGEAGAPRVFHPGGFGGSAFPHLNAGDTLLIPVHTDAYRVNHRFEPARTVGTDDPLFSVVGERAEDRYLKDAANPPVVRNAAPDRLKLLASWVASGGNRPGTATHHTVGAYLEFTAPGTFDLAGRLTTDPAAGPRVPFRVLPKDAPATVVMEYYGYEEVNGRFRTGSSGSVRHGTLAARVGDRVAVGCGGYGTSGLTPADPTKTGVVEALPFRDVTPYDPY